MNVTGKVGSLTIAERTVARVSTGLRTTARRAAERE